MNEIRRDYCINCRKETTYTLKKQEIRKVIKDKEYTFLITVAVCNECGEEISLPGLLDLNIKEIDSQYREKENLITIEDINKLLKIYDIGKGPLALVLGFGEVTIKRYLDGQVPSLEYSNIMKKTLLSPDYFDKKLQENKNKITSASYKKSQEAVSNLQELFVLSDKMRQVIAYLFKGLNEVTPLMLQKLLYLIQGTSYALYDHPMFIEHSQAWVHGPVYPDVYHLFKQFSFNPIDDDRFVLFEELENTLSEEECHVIDLVIHTYGLYSAKVLETITHTQDPWISARKGYEGTVPSHEPIIEENIRNYFQTLHKQYDFSQREGINRYIHDIIM